MKILYDFYEAGLDTVVLPPGIVMTLYPVPDDYLNYRRDQRVNIDIESTTQCVGSTMQPTEWTSPEQRANHYNFWRWSNRV